jgi:hypothetical protein
MKLDPGMHICLHLVFFGKTSVTGSFIVSLSSQLTWTSLVFYQDLLVCPFTLAYLYHHPSYKILLPSLDPLYHSRSSMP